MKRLALGVLYVAAISQPLLAQELPTPKDLPPTEQAVAWIDKDPAVVEARSALAAAIHAGQALTAGSHEWLARASTQRRSYRDGASGVGSSQEWSAQLERSIRIGGKAELDRQLGEVGLEIAQARVGEARHETARLLADLWLGWLATGRALELLKEQLSFAEASLSAVEKRKRAGDASALDLSIAQTDLADVQRQSSMAASNAVKASAKLRARFPSAPLGLLARSDLADPTDPFWNETQWRERIVAEADPLTIAEGQLRKAELSAARAKADRIPDPTLGVYVASEAFRSERIVGVSISIPLSGSYRKERMLQSLQEADAARAAMDRELRDIDSAVAETYADAIGSTERWRIAERGAAAAVNSARLMQRAYALGEADLQSLLLVRRQSLDASRAAVEARADALRSNYRLLIDAHLIWDLTHN